MNKATKIISFALLAMVFVGTMGASSAIATTYTQDCPTSNVGASWYGPRYLNDQLCDSDLYYTWTVPWYKSDWGESYASWYDEGPSSGTWNQYAYIPSSDSYETNGVFYLLWETQNQEEHANQTVSQYGTSNWAYLWNHAFTQNYRIVLTDVADCQGSYYCYAQDPCTHVVCCATGSWECDWGYCCEGRAYADGAKWSN